MVPPSRKRTSNNVSAAPETDQQWKLDRIAALELVRGLVSGNRYVILDTETGGTKPASGRNSPIRDYGDEVLELAMIYGNEGVVQVNTLIVAQQYKEREHPKAFEMHGITEQMLLAPNVPQFTEVWRDYLKPLWAHSDTPIIAWNAAFDIAMLKQTAWRYGHDLPEEKIAPRVFCLMELYAAYRGDPVSPEKQHKPDQKYRWHSLNAAAKEFEIPLPRAHRALPDTRTTHAVLRAMAKVKL